MRPGNTVNVRVATHTVTHTDNDRDVDLGELLKLKLLLRPDVLTWGAYIELGESKPHTRVSTIGWEPPKRSEPIELEVYQQDAKDDDDLSTASNKRPRSWMQESYAPDSNKQRS